MAQASRRAARALQVIRRHVGEVRHRSRSRTSARWLEEFHPHSLVELDYGGLVHLMDDETLQADQSVAELAAALTGLERARKNLPSPCTNGSSSAGSQCNFWNLPTEPQIIRLTCISRSA